MVMSGLSVKFSLQIGRGTEESKSNMTVQLPVWSEGSELPAHLAHCVLPLSLSAHLGRQNFASWYSPEEAKEIARCRISKREDEKLAGKLAAKLSYYRHCFSDPADPFSLLARGVSAQWLRAASILSQEGPPQLQGVTGVSLSISHSRAYAAAATSSFLVGVDIEQLRSLSPGTCRFFLTAREQVIVSSLRSIDGQSDLLVPMIWFVLKEALLKCQGLGLTGVRECSIGPEAVSGSCRVKLLGEWHQGRVFQFHDYLIAFAWAESCKAG